MVTASQNDVRAEFRALRKDCGVYDLDRRAKVILTGSDRVRWLNGMVTNNVRDLATGHGVYAFLLNPQGHILGDLYAYNRGESLLLDTERSQLPKILATFEHYIIMDDVEVRDVSEKLTGLAIGGPRSHEVLRKAQFDVPELEPLQLADLVWHGIGLTVVRGESDAPSYQIWLSPENATRVRDALINAGAIPLGPEAQEVHRIALGIPRYGQDIRERDLPQETEQTRALHFSKGCYIGQEIVERIRSRGNVHRKFTGFLIDGPLPAPGTKIQLDGKDLGEITSAASLPVEGGEQRVALGYIRREAATQSKVLQAGDATAIVAELPFAGI
jgi:folate-binding protein YgfZ